MPARTADERTLNLTPLRCHLALARVLREAEGLRCEEEIEHSLARVEELIREGGFTYAEPHVLRERALLARLRGDEDRARELLDEYSGAPVDPLRVGSILTIPPRPFALLTLNDPKAKRIILREYQAAVARAMAERAK